MKHTSYLIASGVFGSLMLTSHLALSQDVAASNGWYKACNDQGETKICNVQYQAVASTGQVITSINLAEITGAVQRRVFQVTVPTDRLIPPGVAMKVDDKKPTPIPFSFCTPRICAAEVKLDDKLVAVLKSGKTLEVSSTNFQGKANPINITLDGFVEAFDGDPIKQADLVKRQKALEEQLKKKAESAQSELQKALDAAKEQGAEQ
jgi:invasion protein IalB